MGSPFAFGGQPTSFGGFGGNSFMPSFGAQPNPFGPNRGFGRFGGRRGMMRPFQQGAGNPSMMFQNALQGAMMGGMMGAMGGF